MREHLNKTVMKSNAERIVQLADAFGHLHYNDTQTVEGLLNLSIPCARLIESGIVTQVVDSFDSVNDQAVEDVERYCRIAILRLVEAHGNGWWTAKANSFGLDYSEVEPKKDESVQDEIDWYEEAVQTIRIPGARSGVKSPVQAAWAAQVRRQAKRFGVKVTVQIASSQRVAHVRVIEEPVEYSVPASRGEHGDGIGEV